MPNALLYSNRFIAQIPPGPAGTAQQAAPPEPKVLVMQRKKSTGKR